MRPSKYSQRLKDEARGGRVGYLAALCDRNVIIEITAIMRPRIRRHTVDVRV